MEKDIRFTGHTASPSDYESTDGELTQCHNLINEQGMQKSILEPKVLLNLGTNYSIVFIHKTTTYTHYIAQDTSEELYWLYTDSDDNINTVSLYTEDEGLFVGLKAIQSVGNTLIVSCTSGIHYILWTEVDETSGTYGYKYLGDHVPNIEISMGLKGYPKLYSAQLESGQDNEDFKDGDYYNKDGEVVTDETTDAVKDNQNGTFTLSFTDDINQNDFWNKFSEDNQTDITSQVMAKVNKFLREETINKGRFGLPFFVRYALRLYDGSLTCHSAPILMNPTTGPTPIVLVGQTQDNRARDCDMMLVSCSLDYRLLPDRDGNYLDLFSNWTDIVKSIDFFVSAPIYMHDQSGKCKQFEKDYLKQLYFVGALQPRGVSDGLRQNFIRQGNKIFKDESSTGTNFLVSALDEGTGKALTYGESAVESSGIKNVYAEWSFLDIYTLYAKTDQTYINCSVQLPQFEDEDAGTKLEDVQNFYLLKSIDIEDFNTNTSSSDARTDIEVEKDYLQSLTSREQMTDDYLSHDQLFANSMTSYNNRLNLGGVTRQAFRGFTPECMFAHTTQNGVVTSTNETSDSVTTYYYKYDSTDYSNQLKATVYIKEGGVKYTVSAKSRYAHSNFANATHWGCFIFYPNTNAYKMDISWTEYSSSTPRTMTVDLDSHDFLNGAYAVLDYGEARSATDGDSDEFSTDYNSAQIPVLSKLYTSDVDNPFRFDVTNIITVGTGQILSIASAAKALSQGQFGEYPLYAFTTDGVWALTVSSTTGAFSAKQPFTRDVCISTDSITQIDSAVLFATDRGIMLLEGSSTQCLTDVINGDTYFDLNRLPGLASLYTTLPNFDCTFLEYIQDVRMAYDYIQQRIIVFNPNKTYAYVFSLKSKLWGIMQSTLQSPLNSYPNAYAMSQVDGVNYLVDLSHSDATSAAGLLVTRPLKLDAGSILKTVDTVFLRGLFPKGAVQVILYGSRDNINWHLIRSAKQHYLRGFSGTPYKYFRIVAITNLSIGETLLGASVQYQQRLTNKIR